jgi:hypothetical protein
MKKNLTFEELLAMVLMIACILSIVAAFFMLTAPRAGAQEPDYTFVFPAPVNLDMQVATNYQHGFIVCSDMTIMLPVPTPTPFPGEPGQGGICMLNGGAACGWTKWGTVCGRIAILSDATVAEYWDKANFPRKVCSINCRGVDGFLLHLPLVYKSYMSE